MSNVIEKLQTSLLNFKKAAAADVIAAEAKIKSEIPTVESKIKADYKAVTAKVESYLPGLEAKIKYDADLAISNIKAEADKLTAFIKSKEAEIVDHNDLIAEAETMVASLKADAEKAYSLLSKLVNVIDTPKPVTPTPVATTSTATVTPAATV